MRVAPPEVDGSANGTPEPLKPVAATARILAIVFFASWYLNIYAEGNSFTSSLLDRSVC